MPLKRIKPVERDLGYLRVWLDDLEEIVECARAAGTSVTLEADDNELTDLRTDLPKLGKRLQYFTVRVRKSLDDEDGSTSGKGRTYEILSVYVGIRYLVDLGCQIEAADPDPQTRGVMNDIEKVAHRCRRKFRKHTLIYTGTRSDAPTFWQKNRASIVISPDLSPGFVCDRRASNRKCS